MKKIRAVREACKKEREIKYIQERKRKKIGRWYKDIRKKKDRRWRKSGFQGCEKKEEDACEERN